ncbi:unnamed protein product [Aphanomyces euteiches]|uniref:FYVE-type domain-containing protein n=1 Tax=Aphanomyces euteiches TaxID=100861 RepID=A0A6G0WKV9_9STRA|nr:hypothetical protein Ae201684_014153 [Aphanomyces euteiches]KAH9096222.1 hypothetical protein Ae201684P_009458 [Aphanomyces euteiches]
MAELRFPISDEFFQLPTIQPAEIERYRAFGRQVAQELVDMAKLTNGHINWTKQSKTSTATLFESRVENLPAFLAESEILATVDKVIAVFQTTTMPTTRNLQRRFQPAVLDIVRLYNLTMPTADNSYLYQSLNWLIRDPPLLGAFLRRRDVSFIEHQEVIEIDGRRAYVLAKASIEIPGVHNLERDYNVVRSEYLHEGFIFAETDRPGVLKLLSVHHLRPNGSGNSAFGKFVMSHNVRFPIQSIEDVERLIRSHQLSQLTFVDQFSLPTVHTQSKCQVCSKAFGNGQKGHCRHCSRIVCVRPCSAEWDLVKGGLSFTVRICVLCSRQSEN